MVSEADVRIVFFGGGSSEQKDSGLQPAVNLGLADKFFSDALFLMGNAHGKIGKISDVNKIGHGAGDADEQVAVPGGDDQVRVLEHRGKPWSIIDWPAGAESRGFVQIDHFIEVEIVATPIFDHIER